MGHKFDIGQIVEFSRGCFDHQPLVRTKFAVSFLPQTETPRILAIASRASPKNTNGLRPKASSHSRKALSRETKALSREAIRVRCRRPVVGARAASSITSEIVRRRIAQSTIISRNDDRPVRRAEYKRRGRQLRQPSVIVSKHKSPRILLRRFSVRGY